jgi:signal transduction histidine kinase
MFNLLSNALKFSDEGATVIFGAKDVEDGEIMLWVEDEGQGIPLEEQEAIFSKFYKGRNQEAAKGKSGSRSGTGLGLPIVKSFIELHGGRVVLSSKPQKGARFECYLLRENPELKPQENKPLRAKKRHEPE